MKIEQIVWEDHWKSYGNGWYSNPEYKDNKIPKHPITSYGFVLHEDKDSVEISMTVSEDLTKNPDPMLDACNLIGHLVVLKKNIISRKTVYDTSKGKKRG